MRAIDKILDLTIKKLKNYSNPEAKLSDLITLNRIAQRTEKHKEKISKFIVDQVNSYHFRTKALAFLLRDPIDKTTGAVISFFVGIPSSYDLTCRIGSRSFFVRITIRVKEGWTEKIQRVVVLYDNKCEFRVYARKFVPVEVWTE